MSTLLIGSQNDGTNNWAQGFIHAGRFQASASGRLEEFLFYSAAVGNVKAGVYSDSGGEPSALLSVNNFGVPCAVGWNIIRIPGVDITSGTYYYLAAISDVAGGLTRYTSGASNPHRYKSQSYASGLPSPAGTGYSSSTTEDCYAGYTRGLPLIGYQNDGDEARFGPRIWMAQFSPRYNGRIARVRFYSTNAGNVKCGIYDDAANLPNNRLTVNNDGIAVSVGWNTIKIPGLNVSTGSPLWLAFLIDGTGRISRYTSGVSELTAYKSYTYADGLPDPAGTGYSTGSTELAMGAFVEKSSFMF